MYRSQVYLRDSASSFGPSVISLPVPHLPLPLHPFTFGKPPPLIGRISATPLEIASFLTICLFGYRDLA